MVIFRLFNTVGPRQTGRYGMVIPTFVKRALQGHPLPVFGDGAQSRCFTYVGDVVEAILGLARERGCGGACLQYRQSDEEVTMRDLAKRVIERTGSRSEIHSIPYDEAYEEGFEDMRRRVPAIDRIRELTGWEPRTGLDEILDRVAAYFTSEGARS